MALRYKEAHFPPHYRHRQVRQIMNAVYKLRSIAVNGLAGMGKSNVVRFIVSHPQVRSRYLGDRANDYAFVHVDCAGLPAYSADEILREIAREIARNFAIQLQREQITEGEVEGLPDARRALKAQILDIAPKLNLVLVLDYFDEAATQLDQTFFNYLFHLRNARPWGNLSYILATRRPMGTLYELQELLDDHCTIGPLDYRDALDSIRRDEERLGYTFDDSQRDQLVTCTGGHPGFLKNASELLASGKIDVTSPLVKIVQGLLQSGKIEHLCEELWNDLSTAEQGALCQVVQGNLPSNDADLSFLEQSGLLARNSPQKGSRLVPFCPLFQSFVRAKAVTGSEIRIAAVFPNYARIQTSAGEKRIVLAPKLFDLLQALTAAPDQVLPADDLISQVYGTEAVEVSTAALSQLVKRLRAALDPYVQQATQDPAFTCVETVRAVGYRLNV